MPRSAQVYYSALVSGALHLLVTEHMVSMGNITTAAWRNGIASDYESGDCRFDPCGGHSIFAVDLIHVQ